MTLKSRWRLIVPIGCAIMTANCAASRPPSVMPPRLTLPDEVVRPCQLAVLPARPTRADLDAAYVTRGAQLVACDAARRLAVETLMAERALQDRWR